MPNPLDPVVKARLLRRLPEPPRRMTIRADAGIARRDVSRHLSEVVGIDITEQAVRAWETRQITPGAAFLEPYVELLERLDAENRVTADESHVTDESAAQGGDRSAHVGAA